MKRVPVIVVLTVLLLLGGGLTVGQERGQPQGAAIQPQAAAASRTSQPSRPPSDARLPDLVPELTLPGGGILFPLQLLIMNEGSAAAPPSRARVTWHLNCHSADGSSSKSFPVGPQDKTYSIPGIGPQQSYNVPGLSGPNQYCKAPAAATRQELDCDKHCWVRAVADYDRVVAEADETNNVASTKVKRLP